MQFWPVCQLHLFLLLSSVHFGPFKCPCNCFSSLTWRPFTGKVAEHCGLWLWRYLHIGGFTVQRLHWNSYGLHVSGVLADVLNALLSLLYRARTSKSRLSRAANLRIYIFQCLIGPPKAIFFRIIRVERSNQTKPGAPFLIILILSG